MSHYQKKIQSFHRGEGSSRTYEGAHRTPRVPARVSTRDDFFPSSTGKIADLIVSVGGHYNLIKTLLNPLGILLFRVEF